jgi:hypothetical protein
MASCDSTSPFLPLDLPTELSDVAGLIQTDLRAIVNAVVERANDRLLLTRREYRSLQQTLWNRLVASVNEVVQPLSAESR